MPSDQHKPHDPAILIWVPVGETPTAHAFAVSGASTFGFLPDAVIHAQKAAAHRPEKPWISLFECLVWAGPDQSSVRDCRSQRSLLSDRVGKAGAPRRTIDPDPPSSRLSQAAL